MSEAKWPVVPAEVTGAKRELLEWLYEVLAERGPWRSLYEACKEAQTGVRGQSEPRLGVNKTTVQRWMRDETLPEEDKLRLFCERYNKAVEGLAGYAPIPDDERDRMLAVLAGLHLQNTPTQRLKKERARYDDLSRAAAGVCADRDGLLAELADERRTAAERCHAVEQRMETLRARHRQDQRRLRRERRRRTAEAGRRQWEAAVHAAAQKELAQARLLVAELRHALTTAAGVHEQALAERDRQLAGYLEELAAVRGRLAALELDQADREADDAVIGEAIATVEQAQAQLHQQHPDPGRLARTAREDEVIAQLEAADGDLRAVRGILRTVASTWSDDDIDLLVVSLCFTSVQNDWGPALARRLARRARVHYWVEPDLRRLLRGPGYGLRMWCLLRGVRISSQDVWPETFYKPLEELIGSR
ncbi:hypothetical protein AB0L75_41880 [Streptomyces sp. NPDC052101]|uniref:hypothetical protein n=1 Tax=Streptomyces sp. NPDC052101 TaxID=3155763 RepID=UPI0034162158